MFTPFRNGKTQGFNIDEVSALIEDQVAEGFFVEYKQQLVSPKKIANSIASFANSNGGWYIVGMVADRATNTPIALSPLDCQDPVSTIRDAVRAHLNPIPVFFIEAIKNTDGALVVVVQVPDRQDAPIVSGDGRIYRRTADSSDPIPENDRRAIDRITDLGRENQARFLAYCSDSRTHCAGESDQPWIHVYMRPSPDCIHRPVHISDDALKLQLEEWNTPAKANLTSALDFEAFLTFDTIRPGPEGIVLTKAPPLHHRNRLTVEITHRAWTKWHIPIETELAEDSMGVRHYPQGALATFLSQREHAPFLKALNAGSALLPVVILTAQYMRWLGEVPLGTTFEYVIEFENVWRTIPFSNTATWDASALALGVPLIDRSSLRYPPGRETERMDKVTQQDWLIAIMAAMTLGLTAEQATTALVSEITRHALDE